MCTDAISVMSATQGASSKAGETTGCSISTDSDAHRPGRASNYVLGVVRFAVALFFAGMSTKLTAPVYP
jgi:hypothetical protein